MFKSNLKPKKTEKNKFIQKRSGTTSFRSINNYQSIDKIPNDNLYKNDNYYFINKNFEFQEAEEKIYRLFFHYHFRKNSIIGLLIILYLRFCSSQINFLIDLFSITKLLNKINIIHIISLIISLYLVKEQFLKEDKYNKFIFCIFEINHCMHMLNIYQRMDTNFEEFFILSSELIFNAVLFVLTIPNIKDIILSQFIIQVVFFYSIQKLKSIRIIIYGIPAEFFIFIMYIFLKKSLRERWALYDSFKRSYYNMNQGLLEKDPNPIFILSKDKNILFKNNTASKLINNTLDIQSSQKRIGRNTKDDKFNTLNILEIIHPNLKELFKKLLTDAMEDSNFTSFNFPICKSSLQKDLNLNVSDIYDISNEKIYLNLIWFSIFVYKTEWKGKSAFFMNCLPCDHVLLNEIFYKYTKRFTEKCGKMLNNINIIVDTLLNRKEKEENINESSSSSINSYNKADFEEDEDGEESAEERELEGIKDKFKSGKGIHDLLLENLNNKDLNNTILFFFKNQVELLYDYSLTCEIYFNMLYKDRNFRYNSENINPNLKRRIKLKELKSYYSEYFYDFIKEHDYKLEFKEEGENIYNIFIEESYIRVIIFNIIIFMICYLDSNEKSPLYIKKEIIIKLIPEIKDETPVTPGSKAYNDDTDKLTPKISSDSDKNIKRGDISLIFECFSLKGDLNKIHELINHHKNKNICHIKAEILKLNYLDIGILAVNYILENYYKTKLEMSNKEGEQVIKCKIPCELELINSSNNSNTYPNNFTPDTNSFFTSPIFMPKRNINKPKNFYNYNQNYNKKVMNMFYGIKKSPLISPSRHKRAIPSFSNINEINKNRAFEKHLSQKNVIVDSNIKSEESLEDENININELTNQQLLSSAEKVQKVSDLNLNTYSFKQIDFSFDSPNLNNASKKRKEITEINLKEKEVNKDENKSEDIEKENLNKVLIFESQRNKDLITLLNNENKGEFTLKIKKVVEEAEKEMKIKGKCEYNVVLINMGNNKEIKYAEMICENKGKTLIYGYHFGTHTKSKEKNNVKFDKRFDLSFSSEGIVFTLKHVFINNTSIIK